MNNKTENELRKITIDSIELKNYLFGLEEKIKLLINDHNELRLQSMDLLNDMQKQLNVDNTELATNLVLQLSKELSDFNTLEISEFIDDTLDESYNLANNIIDISDTLVLSNYK